jgi:hypothetical protein
MNTKLNKKGCIADLGRTQGYKSSWVYAATRGYMVGRFGIVEFPFQHHYYKQLSSWSVERLLFAYQFYKARSLRDRRIKEGKEQPPGSVYNPELDDGR